MVKSLLTYTLLLLIIFSGFSFSQDDITKRKTELENIRDEISNLETQIKNQTKKEKQSYAAIENYNKQSFLLNKLIVKLRSEEKAKQNEITENQKSINELEKQIKQLQENYSKYVVAVYKYSKMDELAGVFDSESLHQAMVRIKYLQSFSERRENDLKEFEKSKEELVILRKKLEKEVLKKFKIDKEEKNKDFSHYYYQGLLLEIGNLRGYNTFIPSQDKNKLFLNKKLLELATITEIYSFTYQNVVNRARTIDVIWFNERKYPSYFFEVEHSTDFQNSLLKFYDLQDFKTEFFIVSSKSRLKEYNHKIQFSAFKKIKDRVKFVDYDFISHLHSKSYELKKVGDLL